MTPRKPNILVLGTADWNQPIATNQHYVVRELCRDDFANVIFVESMALRAPKFTARDIARILGRLRRAMSRQAPQVQWRDRPSGLTVLSPLTLPWHKGPAKVVNRWLLRRLVRKWTASELPRVLWTYTPATYGIERQASATVYHCVDLLGEVPGIDSDVITANERKLAASGATSAATSELVRSHMIEMGFASPLLWENVADVEVIENARPGNAKRLPGSAIFAGNLSPSKLDYDLLIALARSGVKVRLAGPRSEGGDRDSEQFQRLLDNGVEYLGMLKLSALAHEMWQSAVGIIPYALNSYTLGVSPLKTYEYLAAGLPVVATALPGVDSTVDGVYVEGSHEDFVTRVQSLTALDGQVDTDKLLDISRTRSWRGRGDQVRSLVSDVT